MKRATITFLISDFIAKDYENELKLTSLKHDLIGIRVYDEYELSFPDIGMIDVADLENGEKGLVDTASSDFRKLAEKDLLNRFQAVSTLFKKVKAPLVDIDVEKDYFKPIQKVFSKR